MSSLTEQLVAAIGAPVGAIVLTLLAALAGLLGHVMQKLGDLRAEDPTVTLVSYFMRNPYRSASKLITVLISALALAEPEMSKVALIAAAGIGFAADSTGNRLKSPS